MIIEAVKNYTRVMAPVFSDMDTMPVMTFFLNLFTSGVTIIEPDASVVDIDIQRGNKMVSAYILRGTDAENVTAKRALLEKFTSDAKVYPLIEEITPVTSTMIGKRMPGESVENPLSRMEKQLALAMKAHKEDLRRIIRKMEYSAAESIRTGAQTVKEGAYDFYRKATHNTNATAVWSDTGGAVPITDLDTAGTLIFRDAGRVATDVIFSEQSWNEFLNTDQIKELADSRRIIHFFADMTAQVPAGYESWTAAGAVFQGQVKAGNWKLNMWTYPAIWETDAGVQTQYLPDEEVIILAKGARFDRYFGPADRLEMGDDMFYARVFGIGDMEAIPANVMNSGIFQSDMFHMDAFGGHNNKEISVRTQCAPIFPTTETDAIVKLAT